MVASVFVSTLSNLDSHQILDQMLSQIVQPLILDLLPLGLMNLFTLLFDVIRNQIDILALHIEDGSHILTPTDLTVHLSAFVGMKKEAGDEETTRAACLSVDGTKLHLPIFDHVNRMFWTDLTKCEMDSCISRVFTSFQTDVVLTRDNVFVVGESEMFSKFENRFVFWSERF